MNLDEFLNDCHANACEDDVERTDKLIALVRKLREQRDAHVSRVTSRVSVNGDFNSKHPFDELVDADNAALDEIVREG